MFETGWVGLVEMVHPLEIKSIVIIIIIIIIITVFLASVGHTDNFNLGNTVLSSLSSLLGWANCYF